MGCMTTEVGEMKVRRDNIHDGSELDLKALVIIAKRPIGTEALKAADSGGYARLDPEVEFQAGYGLRFLEEAPVFT